MPVIEVNDSNFIAEVQNSTVPVMVDFFATWCGPCKMLSPTIHEIGEESDGSFKVCKVDIDMAPALVKQFRIMSVPTIVIMSGGKEVKRLVGGQSKEQLLKAVKG